MPDPQADPNLPQIKRVALHALVAGAVIAAMKFGIFALTNSVAVLSDGLESLINIVAAGMMLYTIWYSNRPADREHPYGHGKIEFLAVGLEGWMILIAGVLIAVEAVRRLIFGPPQLELELGIWLLAGVGVLDAALAGYVWHAGRKYRNANLAADGRHLITDVVSTVGVVFGLVLVRWTDQPWLDPLVAIVMASLIGLASWRLLWQSFHGLMDRIDPEDEKAIRQILDDELDQGHIQGYHKVRHRHTGPFHWIDMHLHVPGNMTVTEGHALASRIEGRIERRLGRANATAHLEPIEEVRSAQGPGVTQDGWSSSDRPSEPGEARDQDRPPSSPG